MDLSNDDTGWLASVPLLAVCLCSVIAVVLWNALSITPDPIDGIYAQPGQWFFLKRTFIYLSILLRKRRSKRGDRDAKGQTGAGYGQLSIKKEEDLEYLTEVADRPNVSSHTPS